jgi:hypothetical protein|nr:MAG TPA: hypothetical protein [Caudoviricetes sp.]
MNSNNKIFNLNRGTNIISADNRIWEIVCHDYPYTKLVSGCSTAYVDILSEVKKNEGGYIIYE